MTAKLQRAFADGKVVVRNTTSATVYVYTSEGNILIAAQTQIDISKRASIPGLKKSANLRGLVKSGVLEVA